MTKWWIALLVAMAFVSPMLAGACSSSDSGEPKYMIKVYCVDNRCVHEASDQ